MGDIKYTDWTPWEEHQLKDELGKERVRFRYFVKDKDLHQEVEVQRVEEKSLQDNK